MLGRDLQRLLIYHTFPAAGTEDVPHGQQPKPHKNVHLKISRRCFFFSGTSLVFLLSPINASLSLSQSINFPPAFSLPGPP